eukprot:g67110.t1
MLTMVANYCVLQGGQKREKREDHTMSISLEFALIPIGLIIGAQVGGMLKARATYKRLQNEGEIKNTTFVAKSGMRGHYIITLRYDVLGPPDQPQPSQAGFIQQSFSVSPQYWHTVNAQPGQPGPQIKHLSDQPYIAVIQDTGNSVATNQSRAFRAIVVMMIIIASAMIGPIYGLYMVLRYSDGAGRPSILILVATFLGSMIVGAVISFLFCRCGQASRQNGTWYSAGSFPLTGNVDAAAAVSPSHNPGLPMALPIAQPFAMRTYACVSCANQFQANPADSAVSCPSCGAANQLS